MRASLAALNEAFTLAEVLPFPVAGTVQATIGDEPPVDATYSADRAEWDVPVPATATAAPGPVVVTWEHSAGQTAETIIDVRDGNPFPWGQLKRMLQRGGSTPPLEEQRRALEEALTEFEDECQCRMVPQVTTERLSGRGSVFVLDQARPLQVLAAPDDLDPADVQVAVDGEVTFPAPVGPDAEVTYLHGERGLAADVGRAVAMLAASALADGPWDDRAYGVTGEGGMVRLLTAGVSGARFSIPAVQTAYARHRMPSVG